MSWKDKQSCKITCSVHFLNLIANVNIVNFELIHPHFLCHKHDKKNFFSKCERNILLEKRKRIKKKEGKN